MGADNTFGEENFNPDTKQIAMNTEFKIILTVKKIESHFPEVVLETKTARFRDKSEGFVDFISSAEKFEDADYSELLKQNKEMREMLEIIYNIENGAFGLKSFNVEDLKRKIKRTLELTPKN